ncbi:unnamed protein product [Medioppia subpectinata]|uniref:C2H2-type domain-containing protein n=1 Tax=Medioppia subpectinata TaxID=1979941 RepID=A0A7R9KZ80_9ACAR|nr:unnamed protein product [Medioppia subpectinata]CAG2112611.1 unnamed protein product [Medioppia subpectinata]
MSMNWFTCLTCRVNLLTGDDQRIHYKSEWHSYNLKRRLAQIPVVTLQQFSRIEELHRSPDNDTNALQKTRLRNKSSFYCNSCGKQFNNEKAFAQHMSSKKHLISVANKKVDPNAIVSDQITEPETREVVVNSIDELAIEDDIVDDDEDSDWESVGSDEDVTGGDPILPNECLFCEHSSDTIEDNVCHMSQKHSFFIPDVEYVKDLPEFIGYLGEKVGFGHFCLWCCDSGKRFRTRRAAQQHMTDRGHTKLNHSDDHLPEYSSFYDYTTSYPDFEANQPNDDEEISVPHLEDQDWQLTLPSGAIIGHRSLFRYYKQNLKPLTENTGKPQTKSSAILEKVMSKYRALGWTGITGEAALQRAKDIKFIHRIQRKHELKLGQNNNKNLQKHFRNQIGFST